MINCSEEDDTLKHSTLADISVEKGSDEMGVTSFQKAHCGRWVRKINWSPNKSFHFLTYPSYPQPTLLSHVGLHTSNFTSSSFGRQHLISSKSFCSRVILRSPPVVPASWYSLSWESLPPHRGGLVPVT